MFGLERLVRRSRSYAPYPLELHPGPCVLAVGAELKSTFCLARGGHAFVSQHLGDLDDEKTLRFFEETVELYERLFRAEPQVVAHDLHPDYLSTRYAQAREGVERVAVQHHHAHIAACMAENGLVPDPAAVLCVDPVGPLEMAWLLSRCRAVLTDSGGLLKEAYFHAKPTVVLRKESEWSELVDCGAAVLAGWEAESVAAAGLEAMERRVEPDPGLYGGGRAAEAVVEVLAGMDRA
jgi:UDP-N-acetylglucosamine 2-epimerase